ncbi:pentatricopeptide repeat-containing protein At4g02750-like [Selaginella moellendorffii]|uniref:pentatricopeptide repeat-containing protein At4g02750-like n=1 Tax=Selaginella moellendorffii TaxID=88036 RepID=UPI000D1C5EA6|nr:pentatricopeptide repeat-containing protein At4g02750-like [Selaginella moellendorffii]|eukprot:XP_024533800.1 pentatricopeptide repeat-containing protein At4g02750-like [Selaginella moellendorffii]
MIALTKAIAALARDGRVEDAAKLFDSMAERDLVAWNAILAAHARSGDLGATAKIFREMPQRDIVSWTTAMAAYSRRGLLDHASALFDRMPLHDLASTNAMIAALARAGEILAAEELFDSMPVRDLASCGAMLDGYARASRSIQAGEFFHRGMPEWDLVSMTVMINLYAQLRHFDAIQRLLDRVPIEGLYLWNSLLSIYAREEDLAKAREVFDRMPQRDIVSWNSLLSANANSRNFGRDGDDPELLFDRMPQHNLISWTILLTSLANRGALTAAFRCFDRIPQEPSIVCWNALITACLRSAQPHFARQIFDRMPQRDLSSWNIMLSVLAVLDSFTIAEIREFFFHRMPAHDLTSWNAMLKACVLRGNLSEASRIFSAIPLKSLACYTTLLAANAQSGHVHVAEKILENIPEIDLAASTAMLTAYAQNGQLDNARILFQNLKARDLLVWNAILAAHRYDILECQRIFDEMPEYNAASWITLLMAYAEARNLEIAQQIFRHIPEQNLDTWNGMLLSYARNAKLECSSRLLNHIPERNHVSWTIGITAFAQFGHPDEAFAMFSAMVMDDITPDESCFVSLLVASTFSGKLSCGKSVFVSMILDFGISPTKSHYGCLVDLLARGGYLEDAANLIADMPFIPSRSEWTILLRARMLRSIDENWGLSSRNRGQLKRDSGFRGRNCEGMLQILLVNAQSANAQASKKELLHTSLWSQEGHAAIWISTLIPFQEAVQLFIRLNRDCRHEAQAFYRHAQDLFS